MRAKANIKALGEDATEEEINAAADEFADALKSLKPSEGRVFATKGSVGTVHILEEEAERK